MGIKEAEEKTREILDEFDSSEGPLSEYHISDTLRPIRLAVDEKDRTSRIWMEEMAFLFSESGEKGESQWGTYFGPFSFGSNEQGQWEAPSIKQVTPEVIDYWAVRAVESKHPILRARYAGLVWDFAKRISGKAPAVMFALIRIDAILEMVDWGKNEYDLDVVNKLRNALSLSISLRDEGRKKKIVAAIIRFEDLIAEDSLPGLWGFSFEMLVNKKGVQLEKGVEEKLVGDLEDRLERVSNPRVESELEPWAAEKAAHTLADYFRRKKQNEESHRVLRKYGLAFEKMAARRGTSATVSSAWFKNLARAFSEFGLNEESQNYLDRVRGLGGQIRKEMKEYSTEVSVSRKDVREHVESAIQGGIYDAIAKTVLWHIPTKDDVVGRLKEFVAEAPLFFHLRHELHDHDGRPVAVIGPITEDLDGHIAKQIGETITFPVTALVMRELMSALVEKFKLSTDSILDLLYESPLFREEKRSILSLGINAFLERDFITSIHLLIPQVEDAVRRLVEISGGSVVKFWKSGGLALRTFDDLLRHESMAGAFGEDAQRYLRVLFTDPKGLNLRNDVCHGNVWGEELGMTAADRVFHSLLLLSRARLKEKDGLAQEAGEDVHEKGADRNE